MRKGDRLLNVVMNLSLGVGIFMFLIKALTYVATGSTVVLADAAESVVHSVAVGFAVYSLHLVRKEADRSHNFGYDRIAFFSAGFEGAMIILASFGVLYVAAVKFLTGPNLEQLGIGTSVEALAFAFNSVLGLVLFRVGKRQRSLIVEADGKHVLADSVTSLAAVVGLLLCLFAKNPWFASVYFDPIFATLAGANILREGIVLCSRAIGGLLDLVQPEEQRAFENTLTEACRREGIDFHQARMRNSGSRYWFQFHLIFPESVRLENAHEIATRIEQVIEEAYPESVTTTHLESERDHDVLHRDQNEFEKPYSKVGGI